MKVSLKQSAMPTSPTANQDFTDTGFSSDVKLLFPFFTRGVTNNTIADEYSLSIGATDGATQAAIADYGQDNIGTNALSRTYVSATNAAILPMIGGGGTLDAEAPGSLLSNGGRLAWASWSANELINALMLGGSDVVASVVSATLNGTTPVSVTHGLGDTPDIIIAFTTGQSSSNATGNCCIGFYDRVGATYASVCHRNGGSTTTQTNQYVSNAAIALEIDNTSVVWTATVNTIGATTFNVVASAATTDIVKFICLKVTSGAYKVGTFTTKTTTGTQADITGMSLAPSIAIYVPARVAALNTHNATGNSESMGLGVAVNNTGSTAQAAIAAWHDDGTVLGTTDAKCVTSNTKAGIIFSDSGTIGVDWEHSSWDSGGLTNNYLTADGSARYVAYLAIAGAASAPTITGLSATVYHGSSVTITGTNFGATQGASTVKLQTADASPTVTQATITTWSDSEIILTASTTGLPFGTIKAVVTTGSAVSADITHTSAPGYANGTVNVPWPGGAVSVFDAASPAVVDGDLYEYETLTDQLVSVEVFPDGTFIINSTTGTHKFDVRVYDQTTETWSAWAEATVTAGESANASNGMSYRKVYALSSITGKRRWVDYIPVKVVTPAAADIGTFDEAGGLYTVGLTNITGLTAWIDYIPVYVVTDPASGVWRYNDAGWLPVTDV